MKFKVGNKVNCSRCNCCTRDTVWNVSSAELTTSGKIHLRGVNSASCWSEPRHLTLAKPEANKKEKSKPMSDLGTDLCEHCPRTDYGLEKVNTAPHNLCEGVSCNEAYDNYLEQFSEEKKMEELKKPETVLEIAALKEATESAIAKEVGIKQKQYETAIAEFILAEKAARNYRKLADDMANKLGLIKAVIDQLI